MKASLELGILYTGNQSRDAMDIVTAQSAGEVVERLATQFAITEREVETVEENVTFKLPRGLEAA